MLSKRRPDEAHNKQIDLLGSFGIIQNWDSKCLMHSQKNWAEDAKKQFKWNLETRVLDTTRIIRILQILHRKHHQLANDMLIGILHAFYAGVALQKRT